METDIEQLRQELDERYSHYTIPELYEEEREKWKVQETEGRPIDHLSPDDVAEGRVTDKQKRVYERLHILFEEISSIRVTLDKREDELENLDYRQLEDIHDQLKEESLALLAYMIQRQSVNNFERHREEWLDGQLAIVKIYKGRAYHQMFKQTRQR